jgi:glutamine amidotransferase
MCELFGISSRLPTTVQISLAEFARRGGATGPHIDGWGVGFHRDGDFLLVREPEPSHASAHLRFIHDQRMLSSMLVSHIRRATQGAVCLRNTQPFLRECGGRPHLFAHNGDLGPIRLRDDFNLGGYRPIGESDSEFSFCILLGLLRPLWQSESSPPLQQRFQAFCEFAERMTVLGAANFLYSDGEYLFAHSHRRRQDNGEIRAPGLYRLTRSRHEHEILRGMKIDDGSEQGQIVTLLASVPLSDEPWQPVPEYTALALHQGEIVAERQLQPRLAQPSAPAEPRIAIAQ